MVAGCIPVIAQDGVDQPGHDVLPYEEFSVREPPNLDTKALHDAGPNSRNAQPTSRAQRPPLTCRWCRAMHVSATAVRFPVSVRMYVRVSAGVRPVRGSREPAGDPRRHISGGDQRAAGA